MNAKSTAVLLAILSNSLSSCGGDNKDARVLDVTGASLAGKFVFGTRYGDDLNELRLPSGTIRTLAHLEQSGIAPRLSGVGTMTLCGGEILTNYRGSTRRSEMIYALNAERGEHRIVRRGLWPTCGPRNQLFFFDSQEEDTGISLYAAPLDDPGPAQRLIGAQYSLPESVVIVGDRYVATYDPSRSVQVLFQVTESGVTKLRTGADCEPVFWRSRTNQLICRDADGNLRGQELQGEPGDVILNLRKVDVDAILHYFPETDDILCSATRGEFYSEGHFLREYQDLVKVNLGTGKRKTLMRDVDIDVGRFVYLGPN